MIETFSGIKTLADVTQHLEVWAAEGRITLQRELALKGVRSAVEQAQVDYDTAMLGLRRALAAFRWKPDIHADEITGLAEDLHARVSQEVATLVSNAEHDVVLATVKANSWLQEWNSRRKRRQAYSRAVEHDTNLSELFPDTPRSEQVTHRVVAADEHGRPIYQNVYGIGPGAGSPKERE